MTSDMKIGMVAGLLIVMLVGLTYYVRPPGTPAKSATPAKKSAEAPSESPAPLDPPPRVSLPTLWE